MAVTNGNEEEKRVLTGIGTAATGYNNGNGRTGYGKPYSQSDAVTAAQKQMEQAQGKDPGAYTPGESVTTAQQRMEQAQGKQPGAYQQSDAVNAAQQALLGVQAAKPQSYSSKYGQVLDNILLQIQNPQDFKYEFNGDNLFKAYADLYTQKGRQASMNAMGQAAALTGGYGNSYAQQVGNQAYDQYLLSLYDKGLDLRDRAYQKYVDDRADLYNQYNAFHTQDETDYGRYRDTVNDWKDDRNYYTDYYNTERNFDYGKYRDTVSDWRDERDYYTDRYDTERNFDYGAYRDTVSDYRDNRDYYTGVYNNEKNFDYGVYSDQRDYDLKVQELDESIRQFNESMNWDKMSSDQKYAAEYAMQILAMGQMPSEELLQAAGLSAEDAQKLMAQIQTGGNSGVKNNKTYYVDKFGKYYYYDDEGNARSVNANDIKDTDLIDKSEDVGTKGAQAEINDKYRKENDKLKKHYDRTTN